MSIREISFPSANGRDTIILDLKLTLGAIMTISR